MPTTTFLTQFQSSVDTSIHNLYYRNTDVSINPSIISISIPLLSTSHPYFTPYEQSLKIGDEYLYSANGTYYSTVQGSSIDGDFELNFIKNGSSILSHSFTLPHAHSASPNKFSMNIKQIVKGQNLLTSECLLHIIDTNGDVTSKYSFVQNNLVDNFILGNFGLYDSMTLFFESTSTSALLTFQNLQIKIIPF